MLSGFKKGVPILESELLERGITLEQISTLVNKEDLKKYDKIQGVFYINESTTVFGSKLDTVLSIDDVVKKVYIGDNNDKGYYYNLTLLNNLGACNQVPYITEIISVNVERKEDLIIDNREFIIYPYKDIYGSTSVDKLKIIFDIVFNKYESYLDDNRVEILSRIIKGFRLSESSLKEYSCYIKDYDNLVAGYFNIKEKR